jgi:hypothetical protein
LSIGADDYLIKPFDPREVVARVRAILLRSNDNHLLADRLEFNGAHLAIDSLWAESSADGKWKEAPGEMHDYLGFSMADNGFYSSGHPAPGTKYMKVRFQQLLLRKQGIY